MLVVIHLSKEIDNELASELEKQSAYVSTELRSLRVSGDRRSVTAEISSERAAEEVRSKLDRFISALVDRFRPTEGRQLHQLERSRPGSPKTGVYDELVQRGWVKALGHGHAAFTGPALRLLELVDQRFAGIGLRDFSAVSHQYPALISSEVLARCGYFGSFPHTVSMVTHLTEDFDSIEEFRKANEGASALHLPRADALNKPECCLSPAVCYHRYHSLEGQTISKTGDITTSMGHCFRYESRNIVGLDRLWDFRMREVIFVGSDDFVRTQREVAVERVMALLRSWDLACTLEPANDPFFATLYSAKTLWQQANVLKYEIRLPVEPGPDGAPRSIAAGSFNLHGDFFGNTFNINSHEGGAAFTGCAAFGLERWVLGLFTQNGFEPEGWPEELRSIFADETHG